MRSLLVALAALVATPALAQTPPAVLPPETAVVSPGGIDMVTGKYRFEGTDLSMGSDANGGITFTRVDNKGKPFTSNWHIFLNKESVRGAGGNPPPTTTIWKIESNAIAKTYLQDPALGFFTEQGVPTPGYTKDHLMSALKRKHGEVAYFDKGIKVVIKSADMKAVSREYMQIRLDLAKAHMRAVDLDRSSIPHLLSPMQITRYHWKVLAGHGLGRTYFGGTMITGTQLDVLVAGRTWCTYCD